MERSRAGWLQISRVLILIAFLVGPIIIGKPTKHQQLQARIQQLAERDPSALAEFLDQQMVYITEGNFERGDDFGRDDEKPAQIVYLDAFSIDRFEVTNSQYQQFLIKNPRPSPRYWTENQYPESQALYPVLGVRWKDAEAYCTWAGKRLPTEAEWEKACRGSNGSIYPWGDGLIPNYGNTSVPLHRPQPGFWDSLWEILQNPQPETSPAPTAIGSYPDGISEYGVYDLVGNASEWVADYYNWEGYGMVPTRNPLVQEPAWNHVIRGSAWVMPFGSTLDGFDLNRCSARSSSHGDTRDARTGFRCASD